VNNGKICVAFRNPHLSLKPKGKSCRRVGVYGQHCPGTAQERGIREPPKGCIYTLQTPTYSPSHVSSPAGRLVLLFRGVSSPGFCPINLRTTHRGGRDPRSTAGILLFHQTLLKPQPSELLSITASNLPPYHPSSIPIAEWTTNSGKYCPQLPCAALILLCLPRLSRPPPRSPSDPTPSSRTERFLLGTSKSITLCRTS